MLRVTSGDNFEKVRPDVRQGALIKYSGARNLLKAPNKAFGPGKITRETIRAPTFPTQTLFTFLGRSYLRTANNELHCNSRKLKIKNP